MATHSLWRALIIGLATIAGMTGLAAADDADSPVVVELFTSQGCSSCPPADALLHELAKRDDVIALALHVDYWDYIGWKDDFALPGHTARQKAYARVAGRRMIYTPQMIINGTDHVVGTHPMDVAELIKMHDAKDNSVFVDASAADGGVSVTARMSSGQPSGIDVRLVRYEPQAMIEITRGENAGRTLTYTNIVQSWHELGQWDGQSDFETIVAGELPAVILFQKADFGPILAARILR